MMAAELRSAHGASSASITGEERIRKVVVQ